MGRGDLNRTILEVLISDNDEGIPVTIENLGVRMRDGYGGI